MANQDPSKLETPSESFEDLLNEEEKCFADSQSTEHSESGENQVSNEATTVSTPGESGEPWASRRAKDRFGLAFSGGGIRSATFNLGVLQALEKKNLLSEVHYLSTVSGGGYIGGWYSAWKHRQEDSDSSFPSRTPTSNDHHTQDKREPTEVRHLREFSRFLIPRLGLFNPDMWIALSTILAGMIPGVLTALSVIMMGITFWLLVGSPLSRLGEPFWPWFVLLFTFLFLTLTEIRFLRRNPKATDRPSGWSHVGITLAPLAGISLIAMTFTITELYTSKYFTGPEFRDTILPTIGKAFANQPPITPSIEPSSLFQTSPPYRLNLRLLMFPAMIWLSLAMMIFGRPLLEWIWPCPTNNRSRETDRFESFKYINRVIGRLFALGTSWLGLVVGWEIACWLVAQQDTWETLLQPGGTAITGTSIFIALRRWFLQQNPTDPTVATSGRLAWLKPVLPMILSYATVTSIGIFLICLLILSSAELSTFEGGTWLLWSKTKLATLILAEITFALTLYYSLNYLLGDSETLLPPHSARAAEVNTKPRNQQTSRLNCWGVIIGGGTYLAFASYLIYFDGELGISTEDVFRWLVFVAFSGSVILMTFAASFFDTERIGLHNFYRGQLCRAFLGASSKNIAHHAERRVSAERITDDLRLSDLATQRPIHLICCAANDQGNDLLPNLYRGARSATLSPMGVSMGGKWCRHDNLKLSSALTASAAAFNSVMGTQSVHLGRPVAFLLAALNLRLGLWVPNPHATRSRKKNYPGFNFLREMFTCTKASIDPRSPSTDTNKCESSSENPVPDGEMMHLSDGGHFENLAIYELVRRHCRYIVVSDAGADPSYTFVDLGNAIRRIREDFGVEIELLLDPILPDSEGQSKQHLVVGTIHYDGIDGIDKGILIYLKPTLTGDEPSDIKQFQHRSPTFPHDTTVDQFFDESQWEAYRRLGEHTALEAFSTSIPEGILENDAQLSKFFQQYRDKWYPTPKNFTKDFLDLTERFNEVETNIRASGSTSLNRQFFHELPIKANNESSNVKATVEDAYLLMQVCQLLEDVWLGCQLDEYWSHPLNRGWVNYLHRWSGCPSFNELWPFLSPLYSLDFRRFMNHRFGLRDIRGNQTRSAMSVEILSCEPNGPLQKFQLGLDQLLPKLEDQNRTEKGNEREVVLLWNVPAVGEPIVLGALRVRIMDEADKKQYVEWDTPSFRCAPGYVDTELLIHFFEKLIRAFRKTGEETNRAVNFRAVICTDTEYPPATDKKPSKGQEPSVYTNKELVDRVAVLKRLGFSLQQNRGPNDNRQTMQREA